jgi:large subunit ribosomal protein L9
MRETEILLREHVKNLGRCGDIVRVKAGYARNFLVPKGIGIQATEDNKQAMVRRRGRLDVEEAAMLAAFDATISVYSKLSLETTQRADDHGRLYGSVSPSMISTMLKAAGHDVADKDVRLESPIKTVGEHTITIHLHAERSGTVSLIVKAEGADEAPEAPEAPAAAEAAAE